MIDHFSSSSPGSPIPTDSGHSLELEHMLFQAAIRATPSGNIWSPFKSKMNWEIAHWAKLPGPMSTIISDLLNIDGVSLVCNSAAFDCLTFGE